MPTETEFWEVASQVVAERGALVVAFTKNSDQPELGSTLNTILGFKARTQVSITGHSDCQDWQEQVEAFYRLRPGWGRGKSADPSATYYRVKFDASAMHSASSALTPSSPFSGGLVLPSLSRYVETGLRGVSFWPRVLARLIDLVIHYLLRIAAWIMFLFLLRIAAGGLPPVWVLHRLSQTSLTLFLTAVIGLLVYHVICASVSGTTLGKLVLSMQVVQDDGSPCRLKSAFIRELGFFVDQLFFGVVGYAVMKDDPMQKRLGDDWAGTVVTKRAYLQTPAKHDWAMKFLLGFTLGVFADIAFLMLGFLIQMNS